MRDPSPEYYFGDAYRKFANANGSSSSGNSSSGPGSPSNSNGAYVFGSLFVSADSHTPYTDATQVSFKNPLI